MIRLARLFGIALTAAIAMPVVRAQMAFAAAPPADPATPAAPAVPPADPATPPAPGAVAPAPGAEAPPTAPPVSIPADQTLPDNVHNFFHYVMIARFDYAVANAQQLLGRDFKEVLPAMEAEAKSRNTGLDNWLLRYQQNPALKDVITQIKAKLEEARGGQRSDVAWITENIKKLSGGERERVNALLRLRQSGELAVPVMIDVLRDPNQQQLHAGIRWALGELGRAVLNPLVAATEMKKEPLTLVLICDVLSDIQFPEVVPYLLRVAQDKDQLPAVRQAVTADLRKMGVDASTPPGDLFFDQGERFYYGSSGIHYDSRNPVAYVWTWDDDKKMLTRQDVPPATFNDIMSMRSAEGALRVGTKKDAVSLWLAANNKREVDLKEGESSVVYADAPAHFWNVRLGTQYANNVLSRALKDQNTGVALKAVRSLQEIVGQSNLFATTGGGSDTPLLEALRYPDRRVRYEAAIALASALPSRPFAGQERVVLLLAEAVSQTGTPGVLALVPTEASGTELSAALQGFTSIVKTSANALVGESPNIPSVDVIIINDQANAEEVRQLFQLAAANPRLERAAKLILVKSNASPWFRQAMFDTSLSATTATTGEPLLTAITNARTKSGGAALDEKGAGDYSLRAANLLGKLAIARNQVLDLSQAEQTLLGSLSDKRPENVKAVAGVLGQLDSTRTQPALVDKAMASDTPDDVKIATYKAVATSAKFFGPRLDAGRIDKLRGAVKVEGSQEVKNAAAEALGALNLPVEQIKNLILDRPAPSAAPAVPPAAAPAAPAAPAPAAPAPAAPAPDPAAPAAPAAPAPDPAAPAAPATPPAGAQAP